MKRIQFETKVSNIKTSVVGDDTCPMEGVFEYNGREVKFKLVASSVNKDVLKELFGDVGQTVTFAIVANAQTMLIEE